MVRRATPSICFLAALAADRHDGDLAVVVDVAVAHQHRLGDLLDRAEEAVLGGRVGQRLDHLAPQVSSSGRMARSSTFSPSMVMSQWYLLGIHRDDQVRAGLGDLAHVARLDHDARVERRQAVGAHLQRVDVHLDDLGEVDQQVARLDEGLLEGVHVDRRAAAVAAQQLGDLGLADHGARPGPGSAAGSRPRRRGRARRRCRPCRT